MITTTFPHFSHHSIRLLSLCLALLFTTTLGATCNRKAQAASGAVLEDDFELPDIPESVSEKPFSFDDPDPRRTLRTLEYEIIPNEQTVFLIGVSGRLNPRRAQAVQEGILRLITESMCHHDDTMVVWDTDTLTRIATIRNGNRVQDCSPKWVKFKVTENRADLARLNQHFQKMKDGNYDEIADLNVPRTAHFLGQEFHEYPDFPNRILILFGSAVHLDRDGTGSSLTESYPTIGMLRSPLSPFSTREKGAYLGNTVTHFIVNEEDFRNRQHQAGLQNFWSAYFVSQGSPLLTFSPDPLVSERVHTSDLPPLPAYVDDVNPGYVSVVTDDAPESLFAPMDETVGSRRPLPSTLQKGSLQIGLMWKNRAIDLDLHVGLRGEPKRLSWRSQRSDFGWLRKAFGTGWEEVFFTAEQDVEKVEVWVNFYAGNAPSSGASGELRVSFAGQLFRLPVRFPPSARTGNGGDVESPEHWIEIDLEAIVRGRS